MAKGVKNNEPETNVNIEEELKDIEQAIEEAKKPKKAENDPYEKVPFMIPISADNEEDWVCIINGHSYQVQRGRTVLVPKCVVEVYNNQQRQLFESKRRSDELQRAAQDKSSQLAFN